MRKARRKSGRTGTIFKELMRGTKKARRVRRNQKEGWKATLVEESFPFNLLYLSDIDKHTKQTEK